MRLEDVLRQVLGGSQQLIDPKIPTGAYPQINPFTGNPMCGGWWLDDGVCPAYDEYKKEVNNDGSNNGVQG